MDRHEVESIKFNIYDNPSEANRIITNLLDEKSCLDYARFSLHLYKKLFSKINPGYEPPIKDISWWASPRRSTIAHDSFVSAVNYAFYTAVLMSAKEVVKRKRDMGIKITLYGLRLLKKQGEK